MLAGCSMHKSKLVCPTLPADKPAQRLAAAALLGAHILACHGLAAHGALGAEVAASRGSGGGQVSRALPSGAVMA